MKKIYVELKSDDDGKNSFIKITNDDKKYSTYSGYLNTVLVQLRQFHGLTQQNVADVLGITKTEYWRMEQSKFLPNPQRIHLLAYFYNVSLDVLYGMQVDRQYKELEPDVTFVVNGYSLDDFKNKK